MAKVWVIWKSCAKSRPTDISLDGRPKIGSPIERQAWAKVSTDLVAGT